MEIKRRIEIFMETRRLTIIRKGRKPLSARCSACGVEVAVVTPEQAARLAGVSPRNIYQWIEAGDLHHIERPEGSLLICLPSLAFGAGASPVAKPAK